MATSETIFLYNVNEMLRGGANFKQEEFGPQNLKERQEFDKQRMEHSRKNQVD